MGWDGMGHTGKCNDIGSPGSHHINRKMQIGKGEGKEEGRIPWAESERSSSTGKD